jgi:putative ABC transport system permease protein
MGWSRYLRRRRWDAERAREVDEYLEAETADNVARGMPAAEARLAARRKLGNPTLIREEIYRMNTIGILDGFWQDVRLAFRVLRKSPGFAAVAILSLALGIGANTAVFSVVRSVLLRPLPYQEPERLVAVGRPGVGLPEYEFWKEHAVSFASAAAFRGGPGDNLLNGSRAESIATISLTTDFLRTLGIAPALGREFNSAETRPRGPRAIILGDALWRRLFDGDPGVIGRVVSFANAPYTVVGVMPRGFWLPQSADAYLPLVNNGTAGDVGMNTEMIARLKPGISHKQAAAEMPTIAPAFLRTRPKGLPEPYPGLTVTLYHDSIAGDVRLTLLLLFGAVGLLLLIACSNLASLLLARLAVRQKEIALRLALGSGQARILRQFLIENMLLTSIGGIAGFLAARSLLGLFLAAMPFQLPAFAPIRLDGPVLGFTLLLALATGLVFSIAPMLKSSRSDLQDALKSGGRSTSGGGRLHTRNLLVTGEVAISVTLLVAAGLLIQSLYRIHQERLGFDPRGLITFVTPRPDRARGIEGFAPFEPLLERIRSLSGVRAAAGVNVLPLAGNHNYPAQQEGRPDHSIGAMDYCVITPDYLQIMGTPMVRGRNITVQDSATAAPVILVNERLAREWWPDNDPMSGRVIFSMMGGKPVNGFADVPRQVVGVVADTKSARFRDPPRPTIYIPAAQATWFEGSVTWVVRADLSAGIAAQLRQAIADLDPRQRVLRFRTMEEIVVSTTADSRFDAWLFGGFAALALVLTAVGVYGLLSFSVARRTAEIGTRMALGASRADVLGMVLRQGILLVASGLAFGLVGALLLTRSLEKLLFGVKPTDPVSFTAVALLLVGVGLAASYVPARRATKVDPMVALRYE